MKEKKRIYFVVAVVLVFWVITGRVSYSMGTREGYEKANAELKVKYEKQVKVQELKEAELTPMDKISDDQEAFYALSKAEMSLSLALAQNDVLLSEHNLLQEQKVCDYLKEVTEGISSEEARSESELLIKDQEQMLQKSKKDLQEAREFQEKLEKSSDVLDSDQ